MSNEYDKFNNWFVSVEKPSFIILNARYHNISSDTIAKNIKEKMPFRLLLEVLKSFKISVSPSEIETLTVRQLQSISYFGSMYEKHLNATNPNNDKITELNDEIDTLQKEINEFEKEKQTTINRITWSVNMDIEKCEDDIKIAETKLRDLVNDQPAIDTKPANNTMDKQVVENTNTGCDTNE